MKRSEINQAIREAEKFFAAFRFELPAFASYEPAQWRKRHAETAELRACNLGWDITDFGGGNFRQAGLLLFTLRNGIAGSSLYPKPYAEKIMISRCGQLTLLHCHETKREDIINRGGGTLVFQLWNREPGTRKLASSPVHVVRDGESLTLPPGGTIEIHPGESLTLPPNLFHSFQAHSDGDVLIGEVSSVNDDHTDNLFYEEQSRFPMIEEDQTPYRLLVSDYCSEKNF